MFCFRSSVIIFILLFSSPLFAKNCLPNENQKCFAEPNRPNILDSTYSQGDVFGVIRVQYENYGERIAIQQSICKLPFCEVLAMHRYPDVNATSRPSKQRMQMEWPLICVFDELYFGTKKPWNNQQIEAKRTQVLNTLILCGYDRETWGNGQNHTEFFSVFGECGAYVHNNTALESKVNIADLAIISAYRDYQNKQSVEKRTSIADLTLARAFRYEKYPNQTHWDICGIIFFSAVASRNDSQEKTLGILSSMTANTIFGYDSLDEPSMALVLNKSGKCGRTELLRLPLLGPVFSVYKTDSGTHWGPLPNLLNHNTYSKRNS